MEICRLKKYVDEKLDSFDPLERGLLWLSGLFGIQEFLVDDLVDQFGITRKRVFLCFYETNERLLERARKIFLFTTIPGSA